MALCPNANEETLALLPVSASTLDSSRTAPACLREHLPSCALNIMHIWIALATIAGNFFGSLAIGPVLRKHWGDDALTSSAIWILATAMALVSLFGNLPYNLTPIADFVVRFKQTPNKKDGGSCWLAFKALMTLGAFCVNLIGQYWAVQTCQAAARDLKLGPLIANIFSLLFYPMLVLLGTTFVTGTAVDLIDYVENFSVHSQRWQENIKQAFESFPSFVLSLLHLGVHGLFTYCAWAVAQLESKAGHDYAHEHKQDDYLSATGLDILCKEKASYTINLIVNFVVYARYSADNLNILVRLLNDLYHKWHRNKAINMIAALILTILSAGLMTYLSMNNGTALPLIIGGTAALNSAPMVRSVDTVVTGMRYGTSAAKSVFHCPQLSSFATTPSEHESEPAAHQSP